MAEDSSSADRYSKRDRQFSLAWLEAEEKILCHYEELRMANGRKQLNLLIGSLVAILIVYGALKLVSFIFAP